MFIVQNTNVFVVETIVTSTTISTKTIEVRYPTLLLDKFDFNCSKSSEADRGINSITLICHILGNNTTLGHLDVQYFLIVVHLIMYSIITCIQPKTNKEQLNSFLLIKSRQTLHYISERRFNQCGCSVEALSPFGARHYCGDDCTGILMSSLYCMGLQRRESVDCLVTSPPLSLHLAPS